MTFDSSVFNFSDQVDDFDRVNTEKEISKQVTFTNYGDADQRIYIKLTIPEHLTKYSKFFVKLGSESASVTFHWDV
ncbi:unnamed protein product, partial [marine sediment metagenome]